LKFAMSRHAVDGRRRERGAAAIEFAIILPDTPAAGTIVVAEALRILA